MPFQTEIDTPAHFHDTADTADTAQPAPSNPPPASAPFNPQTVTVDQNEMRVHVVADTAFEKMTSKEACESLSHR
jgi:hypothetical protein